MALLLKEHFNTFKLSFYVNYDTFKLDSDGGLGQSTMLIRIN